MWLSQVVFNYCQANYTIWQPSQCAYTHLHHIPFFKNPTYGYVSSGRALTHTHLPGIWMSQGHKWKSAHCTDTEHSCPCRQRWALWTPEQISATQNGDGRIPQHIPAQGQGGGEKSIRYLEHFKIRNPLRSSSDWAFVPGAASHWVWHWNASLNTHKNGPT